MASTSLTGIFAPGSPALVESLRTLVLEPKRTIAPGETIRVEFSFSNLGGAAATGVRVRFAHPQGVDHVSDGDLVDERPLASDERLTDTTGANVGDLEPNAQRRVSCSFRVNDTIEDGTELVFQAALVTDQTPLVASNIERIVVRSQPALQNTATLVTISAPDQPHPGDTITVHATIANTGSSSAHDVIVILPAPEHTSYVRGSARVDGRVVTSTDGEPFDYDNATIVTNRLMPAQSVIVEYQATIESPLADGTRIKATGSIGAREINEFRVASSEIVVTSPIDFSTDDTVFTLFCDDIVTPGMRVPMVLRAVNVGTGVAEHVTVNFMLPAGVVYAPGSAHVDGQPVGDESVTGLQFTVGTLGAGRIAEVGLAATVMVPADESYTLPIEGTLRWKGGSRTFSRRLTVRVAPRFNRARNFVEADRGVAQASEDVRFLVHVYNDGTAAERNVRLRLIPGVHLEDVRVAETPEEPLPYGEPLDLGMVHPHHERRFEVIGRIASRVPDRSNVALGVVLEHEGGAIDLGTATLVVRSRPQIDRESIVWEVASHEALRPHRTVDVVVRFTNSGSDALEDARLALTLPPELAVERAVDARRDRDGLAFTSVPALTTHEARMTLRLVKPVLERTLTIEGWLHGKGTSAVHFPPLDIPTYAEPQFSGAQLAAVPAENVNAGERLYYELRVRNDGDGPAERLTMRVVPTNLAVYVPSTTTINGMPLVDDSGTSSLWSPRGLVLADVNPGVELRVRWEMIVMSPLAAGTMLETRAVLEWGEGHTVAVVAPTLRVTAQPSLGESIAGNAISIARTFPHETPAYEPPPLPEPEPEYTLPSPTMAPTEAPPRAIAEVIARGTERLEEPAAAAPRPTPPPPPPLQPVNAPVAYLDFTAERLANTIRMLERAEAGGLVQHLFAMRMLFPENAIGASPTLTGAFASTSRAVRAPLERFFVKLKMPRMTVTGKDLEDRESRVALRALVDELVHAPVAAPIPPPEGIVRVEGPVNLDVIRALVPELDAAPLGAVAPWLINAQLLGTAVYHDGSRSDALGHYRSELLGVLTVLSELPMTEFHRVLTSSVNRTLDEAFASVLDALRDAAHLAVE